jgi:hypothetical protein
LLRNWDTPSSRTLDCYLPCAIIVERSDKVENMASIRLKGLVSRMQRVREQLVAGIPADQAENFRGHIRTTIQQVEELCAAYHSAPRQLPRPSYQAYRFFKTLDLEHLPLRDPAQAPAVPPLKIRHLLHLRERIQTELSRLANSGAEPGPLLLADDARLAALIPTLQTTACQVEEIAHAAHSHVARLALPSRQAYEWVKFLSAAENLQLHLNALRIAYFTLKEIQGQKRYAGGPFRLSLEFYPTECDWSVHRRGADIHAVLSEGFVGADAAVIEALVRLAFQARRKRYRHIVKEYSAGPEFAELLQAIELPTYEIDPNVQGRHYNLMDVFGRVNRALFDGRLTPPRLTWNKSSTFRVMGHYQYATDTVTVSISLDRTDIPEWAIDHVMHHELLHRVMGAQVVNGRLYSHTPAFREAERAFPDYERAAAFLNQLSATLRRRT